MGWRVIIGFLIAILSFVSVVRAEVANASAGSSEWVVRSWQTENGLPHNTINALLQTRDGFLWVGTSGGLARFDGVRFRKFGLQDGLRSVRISALVEDTQGALWAGTTGGGVSRWEKGRVTTFGAAEGFPSREDIVSMAAARDGSVWIGTVEGLVRWKDGAFTMIGEAEGLPRKQIRALAEDANGTLWVSVLEDGVFRGTHERFARVGESSPTGIYSLLADRDGSIWAGSGNGLLWRWRDGMWQRFSPQEGLPRESFMALAQGADGTVWMAAQAAGVYHTSGERFVSAVGEGDLSDRTVRHVLVDREGSVWVGTAAGGLNRLSRRVLQYWGANAGLTASTLTSVAEDGTGTWWVGAASKGLYRFESGRFRPLEDPAVSATTHHIYSTTSAPDGSIWAAGEGCLYRFRNGEPTAAFLEAPIRGEAIRALCADGDTLWLGTYYSTLMKCDGTKVEVVAPRGSFSGDVTSIAVEAPGTLWIGSAGGVHRWEGGRIVRTWGTRDGLLTANVRTLLRDPDGTLWIGTQGGGLARLKDGKIAHITTRHGLIDDIISQIVADDFDSLTLGCTRGIMRLERRELHDLADGKIAEVHPVTFGRNEGMLREQCVGGHSPTAIKTRDGRLLFPTAWGIAEISPGRIESDGGPALEAHIDGVVVNGECHAPEGVLAIPPGKCRVEVYYSAAALGRSEWVRFRHKLDGSNNGWVTTHGGQPVIFDELKPGRYTFRVVASDGRGEWNEQGARLDFTVRALFWQTIWFRIIAAFALVAVSTAAVWFYQHRRHMRRIAELERARQHQAELARVGRVSLLGELSASLAHELNQPLTAILSNAQAALRFLDGGPEDIEEVRASLKDIAVADRRAGEIITRMRALMKKGEAQMEPRDLNADIEQVLMLLHADLVGRKVPISARLAPDLPPILGDHIQIQQVLLNLVVNGCDAMQGLPPEERGLMIETGREGDGAVRVSVIDQGPGIAPEMLDRVFDPFYSTKSNGLGMGLSICQAIIKAHGGRLWATSNAGRGAAFHFTLREEGAGGSRGDGAGS